MAVMNKLRDNMALVLYALVGLFLFSIVFEWGMNYTGMRSSSSRNLGSVDGKTITPADYDKAYKNLVANFKQQQPNTELDEQTDSRLREQAWDGIVMQTLIDKEIKQFGITVTDNEIRDVINSDNPPPVIAQQFKNPDGSINRQALQSAIADPRNKEVWLQVEDMVRQQKTFEKLQDRLLSAVRVTDSEAKERFLKSSTLLNAKYVLLDLSKAKPDSLYKVDESDIKSYYNQHRDEFKEDPTRSLKYVFFSNLPTGQDSVDLRSDLEKLIPDFKAAKNDSEFVSFHTDKPTDVTKFYGRTELTPALDTVVFRPTAKVGDVFTAFDGEGYHLVKVAEIKSGKMFAKASHILLQPSGNTAADTAKTVAEAKALMRQIKTQAEFEQLAREKSKDPGSVQTGGDLGWFGEGRMVKAFEDAVFKGKVGELVGPIKTQFGVHIIKVVAKDDREIRIANIISQIKASPSTLERQRKNADDFAYLGKEEGFDKEAQTRKLATRETGGFTKTGFIAGIGSNRQVSDFAFKSKIGTISNVIETKEGFAVFQVIDANDDGFRRLDETLKNIIKARIIRDKKIDDLKKQADDLYAKLGGDLDKAKTFDSTLAVRTTGQFAASANFVPGVGRDNVFAGTTFGLEKGQLSKPVAVQRGVAIIQLADKTVPSDDSFAKEKDKLKTQLVQEKKNEVMQNWSNALKKQATIEDKRLQYY
jgi:peptidyl-prolyl cis-trans isomerase D